MDIGRVKLISTQVVVEFEVGVGVELGKKNLYHNLYSNISMYKYLSERAGLDFLIILFRGATKYQILFCPLCS